MGTTLKRKIEGLPPERRVKVEARAAELIAEEMALRDIRKALDLTQERVAELLEIGQDSVSRLEKRSDLRISTLRSYIEALGGRLRLLAEFPDHPPIVLPDFSDEEVKKKKPKSRKQTRRVKAHQTT
jgi:transcriptional regulator with XRE-family HTH domain